MITDMTTVIVLSGAIIGVVEAIKRASNGALQGWLIIMISGLLGVLAGIAGMYMNWQMYYGIDPLTGLMVGLAASGGVTLFQATGKAVGDAVRATRTDIPVVVAKTETPVDTTPPAQVQ